MTPLHKNQEPLRNKFSQKKQNFGEEIERTKYEFREKLITLALGGFGLVAALAWNDAIQSFFNDFFPKQSSSLIGKFGYAIFITAVVVVVSLQLKRISQEKEQ